MKGGDTVDSVGAHDGEVCHAHLLLVSFFDQRHAGDFFSVTGVLFLQLF